MAKGGSTLGTETIATVGLHDSFYMKLRFDYYIKILLVHYGTLLETYKERDNNPLAFLVQKEAFEIRLLASNAEFAGFARAFARFKQLDEEPICLEIPNSVLDSVVENEVAHL
jgi:hypothetical protein